jgi:hypothetical protein
MTKTALRGAGQSGTKHRNRNGAAGSVTRMTHNQVPTGRQAAEPGLTRTEKVQCPRHGVTMCAVTSPKEREGQGREQRQYGYKRTEELLLCQAVLRRDQDCGGMRSRYSHQGERVDGA